MQRSLTRVAGAAMATAAIAVAVWSATPAGASGATATISQVKTDSGVLQFLFSAQGLPPGSVLDPNSVVVDDGGVTLPATAGIGTTQTVKAGRAPLRETDIVLDTSGSMAGDGIAAARAAAIAYATALPADVRIGLVTFSEHPTVALKPTTSRPVLRAAINHVTAGGSTSLYDGIIAAVNSMGAGRSNAQRRMLVLSDGDDTSSSHKVSDAVTSAQSANIAVDVVAFRLPGSHAVLTQLASASHGRVLPAQSTTDLASIFERAAAAFQSQVLVTVQVPDELAGQAAHLVVSMNSQEQSVLASVDLTLPGTAAVQRGVGPAIIGTPVHSASHTFLWVVLGVAFATILVAALLTIWVPAEGRARAGARARLSEVSRYRVLAVVGREQSGLPEAPTEGAVSKAALSFLDRVVRTGGRRQALVERLDRAGMRMRPEEWVAIQVAVVLVLAAVLALVSKYHIPGIFFGGLLGYFGCWAYMRVMTSRRSKAFNDQLPDVLQLMAGSLRSGFSLNQAVAAVVREGNEPTSSEIARALTEVRLGSDLEDALDRVADRMVCPDLHWVVLAVRISREVGGNLAEVILNTVSTMRERAQIRGQIRVLSAEGRISARILIALPFFMATYLLLFQPSYLKPLYTTGAGIGLMIGGAVLLVLGSFWISRIVKIEV